MSNNNNSNNKTNNKKRIFTSTDGEAVKEALDTPNEVNMEGPENVEDIAENKNIIYNANGMEKVDKDIDKGIILSVDETEKLKIEINVKDTSTETTSVEDKIVVNKENTEATVATVTTIPAEMGIEVEVQTEVEVPIDDKDKDVDSDLKVLVHSPYISTEVPLIPTSQSSIATIEKGSDSPRFDERGQQQLHRKDFMIEHKSFITKNTNETQRKLSYYSEMSEGLQKQITRSTRDMAENYMEFQKQTMNSFQSIFGIILENTNNIIRNNQAYYTNVPEMYSKMASIYIENTIAVSKMINDVAFANANTIKKLYST